jgi:amidase
VIAVNTAAVLELRAAAIGRTPSPETLERITLLTAEHGRSCAGPDYVKAVYTLHATSRRIAPFFDAYDLLLTPTLAEPPLQLGELDMMGDDLEAYNARAFGFIPFTYPFNITGQPAMSVPLYWNEAGLPIGAQVVAPYGDEATLFRLAAQLEAARPWRQRRPSLSTR